MSTLLENGGIVSLWSGWSIVLPAAYHERNEDGSWSSWGAGWTIDVHIIDIGGDFEGAAVSAERLLSPEKEINASGSGWIGSIKRQVESDNGKEVFRLAGNLSAENTLMSCWISYFCDSQHIFAEKILASVDHQSENDA